MIEPASPRNQSPDIMFLVQKLLKRVFLALILGSISGPVPAHSTNVLLKAGFTPESETQPTSFQVHLCNLNTEMLMLEAELHSSRLCSVHASVASLD